MKAKSWALVLSGFMVASGGYADLFTWDGGGGNNRVGTFANWNPDISSAADFNTANTFLIANGSAVITDDQNFSLGAVQIKSGSSYTVSAGTTNTFAITGSSGSYWKDGGTLNVDGSATFTTVLNNTGASTLNVSSGGNLTMSGNNTFATGGGSSATLNLNGTATLKFTGGSSANNCNFAMYLNTGAIGIVDQGWGLRSTSSGSSAVYLNGGTIRLPSLASFNFEFLTLSGGDDGVIFTDTASKIVCVGDRTTDVATWVSAGHISSQVGAIQYSYDSVSNETVVMIPEPATLGLFIISSAGLLIARRWHQ